MGLLTREKSPVSVVGPIFFISYMGKLINHNSSLNKFADGTILDEMALNMADCSITHNDLGRVI